MKRIIFYLVLFFITLPVFSQLYQLDFKNSSIDDNSVQVMNT